MPMIPGLQLYKYKLDSDAIQEYSYNVGDIKCTLHFDPRLEVFVWPPQLEGYKVHKRINEYHLWVLVKTFHSVQT